MSAKRTNFIVVALTDLDEYGFNEDTLPALVALADSHDPDYRTFTHLGVQVFFLSSAHTQERVDKLVATAKGLKESGNGYETLGIGVAEGPLLAEFTWLGKVKTEGVTPMGDASSQALKNARLKPAGLCVPANPLQH